jgi:Glycine zipper 2TM domain
MNKKWIKSVHVAAVGVVTASSLLISQGAMANERVVIGAILGAGVGALIGNQVGGREAAIVGSAIGAAVGTTVATQHGYGAHDGYGQAVYRQPTVVVHPAPVYQLPVPVYPQPAPVYYPAPVQRPVPVYGPQRVDYVPIDARPHPGWDRHHNRHFDRCH